ncbi:MAG: DJ-1/PfpI family protein [Acholeplasmataceae bacterium]|jgi:4-methyl-5(b-hydroxyethyl)-thiazole monophosphate biosynthesis
MKGLMIIGNNIEDGEALLTRDLLLRAGLKLDLVSIYKSNRKVKTAYGLNIQADFAVNEVELFEYDFLIIPGGRWVFELLENPNHQIVSKLALTYYNNDKLVAAICAAPMLLGYEHMLKNKNFTCFPSCEDGIDGKYQGDKKVVVEDNIITAKGLGAAFEFSYEIIRYLLGREAAEKVLKDTHYR